MAEERVQVAGIIGDDMELTLGQLCRACSVQPEWLMELVEEGVIEPIAQDRSQWRFSGTALRRVRIVHRLYVDLGVNIAGAALALELLEELEILRSRQSGETP